MSPVYSKCKPTITEKLNVASLVDSIYLFYEMGVFKKLFI